MNIKLTMYSADLSSELSLPFADQGVRAGFPSPAQDYMTDSIDLNRPDEKCGCRESFFRF